MDLINRKAKFISNKLDELFPEPDIPLFHSDPYTLLVAVMLSAQSTDKKVNQITPRLFDLAKTPTEMVSLGANRLEKQIREIGLARTKARNIVAMSRQLLDNFSGQVPDSFLELESLSGVGHKTASVVMAQAFSKPAFPVDTHIHRLAKKWGLSSGKSVAQTEADLKRLFPKDRWHDLHLQIIYYGREYSPARGKSTKGDPIMEGLINLEI